MTVERNEAILASLKQHGWHEGADGTMTHPENGTFSNWVEAAIACIGVASN